MLIFLLIFALIRTLRGVPLSSPSEPLDRLTALDIRDAHTHFGQRGVNDIIISCFATIFTCTWSAVHPNIPAVMDSSWTCFKCRVTITVYTLLALEMMTWWAMNQRVGAKKIMDEYNEALGEKYLAPYLDKHSNQRRSSVFSTVKGWFIATLNTVWGLFQDSPPPTALVAGKGPRWTLAHGFFLQMGGFVICENGIPVQVLTKITFTRRKTGIVYQIVNGTINPPRITEEQITDRSKGDAISKTFIILQTTWFIAQCIARWLQRLQVTELEVVTLGFAMLNGITYILWWYKPQNVGQPVFLESKKLQDPAHTSDTSNSTSDTIGDPDPPTNPGNVKVNFLQRKLRQDMKEHTHSPTLLWRLPYRMLQALLHPLMKMSDSDTVTKIRVGSFYTASATEDETAYAAAAIGILFGSVHLIPSWFLDFPSPQETWLWRVSAIIITAEPIFIGLGSYFDSVRQGILEKVCEILEILVIIGIPLYPIARIILLTLSLTALRSLPSSALQTIEWTTFIPHL